MNFNDEKLERMIHQHINEELEQIPELMINEEWLKFKKTVETDHKNFNRITRALVAAAAIIVITVGSLALWNPGQANAVGERFTQMFNHIVGKTTKNKTETSGVNLSGAKMPSAQNIGDNVEKKTTLEEAQKTVYFKIAEPKNLPGATINNMTISNLGADISKIRIEYLYNGQLLVLLQQNTSGTSSESLLYDTDDTVEIDVTINDSPAILLTSKNGVKRLTWQMRGLMLQLTGNLPQEEFLKIAQSIS